MANTVAAAVRNRMFPPEDDADGAETVLETGRSSARTAPPVPIFLTWTRTGPRSQQHPCGAHLRRFLGEAAIGVCDQVENSGHRGAVAVDLRRFLGEAAIG